MKCYIVIELGDPPKIIGIFKTRASGNHKRFPPDKKYFVALSNQSFKKGGGIFSV